MTDPDHDSLDSAKSSVIVQLQCQLNANYSPDPICHTTHTLGLLHYSPSSLASNCWELHCKMLQKVLGQCLAD